MVNTGDILISEPYLGDNNFERTVILLCEVNNTGVLGYVLNKPTLVALDSVIESIVSNTEMLFIGGPVSQDSLHFIYKNEYNIEGSVKIMDNLYWGGNFDQVIDLINNRQLNPEDFRFFLGYSGWDEGQLEEELKNNSWIVSSIDEDELFKTEPEELWRASLKKMGGKYKMYSNYPVDPRLN
ncbi:MAG: YqgE/AlgH family protein [Cytophagaceae bacterium]